MNRAHRQAEIENQRKAALMAFAQALNRESHHLIQSPELTWPLLFNRLQWEQGLVQERLAPQLAARSRPWIRTWSPHAESGTLIRTIPAHYKSVLACAVSPDGYIFASGSMDGTLKLWDASNGRQRFTLSGHDGPVGTCTFSPDGCLLLSGSWDTTLKIWDASTGQEVATLPGHTDRVNDCSFSIFGCHILSAGEDGTLIFSNFPRKEDPLIPSPHLEFLSSLLPMVELDDYYVVHAGFRPYVPIEDQDIFDMTWIRNEFLLSEYDFGKVVIFGHTPFNNPVVMKNKMGIDTGAVYGNRLTCLELPEVQFHSVAP